MWRIHSSAPAVPVVADAHKAFRHAASREQHNSAISRLSLLQLSSWSYHPRDSAMAEEELLNLTAAASDGNPSVDMAEGNVTCSDQVSLKAASLYESLGCVCYSTNS